MPHPMQRDVLAAMEDLKKILHPSRDTGRGYCYVLYHHVTPEHITRLPVHISCPDTTGTNPAARIVFGSPVMKPEKDCNRTRP